MSDEHLIAAALLVPAVGAGLIACAGRWPNLREAATLTTSLALCAVILALLPGVLDGQSPELVAFEMFPGIAIAFRVEPLGMLFALVASGLWIVNSVYSIGYMRGNNEAHQTRFYTCFALALSATMGIALASNLLTLFLFYELLTLVTWPLVAHHGDEQARKGGRVYLGVLLGTSLGLLLLVWFIWRGIWYYFPLALIVGYAFAWFAHFVVEKNEPATFKYPLWSFISDYKMMWYMITGRMNAEVERVVKPN